MLYRSSWRNCPHAFWTGDSGRGDKVRDDCCSSDRPDRDDELCATCCCSSGPPHRGEELCGSCCRSVQSRGELGGACSRVPAPWSARQGSKPLFSFISTHSKEVLMRPCRALQPTQLLSALRQLQRRESFRRNRILSGVLSGTEPYLAYIHTYIYICIYIYILCVYIYMYT